GGIGFMTVLYLRFAPPLFVSNHGRRRGLDPRCNGRLTAIETSRPGDREPFQPGRSTDDDRLRLESSRGLVELPSCDVFRLAVDDAYDHVGQPARRARSIVLGRGGRMIRMAVIDPDEIEIFLPRVIVSVKELERIDHVPPRPVLRRHVSRATRFLDAPRCAG